MPDKFRLGIHEEEFEKVALRAKRSAQYEVADSGPWKSDF